MQWRNWFIFTFSLLCFKILCSLCLWRSWIQRFQSKKGHDVIILQFITEFCYTKYFNPCYFMCFVSSVFSCCLLNTWNPSEKCWMKGDWPDMRKQWRTCLINFVFGNKSRKKNPAYNFCKKNYYTQVRYSYKYTNSILQIIQQIHLLYNIILILLFLSFTKQCWYYRNGNIKFSRKCH